jgi:hypothetical protein
MSNHDPGQGRISGEVKVEGDLSGNVAIGEDIRQYQESFQQSRPKLTPEELAELDTRLRELREAVAEAAPADQQERALERLDELETAVKADEPDLTTMEYVRNWFARHLPALAGTVTSVIVNPIVGKLVAAAGDAIATEFKRRFGRGPET